MKKGLVFILISVFLFAGLAMAKGPEADQDDLDLPENKWWHNDHVVRILKLTEQEQSQLNDLFVNSQRQLFDLKANVQKEKFEIEQLLEQKKLDEKACMERFKKLTQAQNTLRQNRFQFLLEVRKILGLERYQQLKTKFQQRHRRQRGMPFPSGRRGPGAKFPPGMMKGKGPGMPPGTPPGMSPGTPPGVSPGGPEAPDEQPSEG